MNINRHNYEEFFLLYVDNELTAGQRKIVEAFVATNPDLQEEFELIQQSTFTTDVKLDETFINSLLKPVGEESSISEEQLLLYVDNELSTDEKAAVERELVASPSLQKELQWLRRSQVTADTAVVFPDKSLLYKQAEPARVFSMSITARRWSAAAAVALLLGSAIWFTFDSNKSIEQPDKVAVDQPLIKKDAQEVNRPNSVKEILKETLEEQNNELDPSTTKTESTQQQPTTKPSIASVDVTTKPGTTVTTSDEKTDPVITEPVEKTTEKKVEEPSNNPTSSTVQSIASTNNGSTTVYDEDAANEEEGTLFTEERQRKSGIAGFLKKAKRTFERKTGIQSSSSEVRFAVFAVNTQ